MSFNKIQTFYIDKKAVNGASKILLSSIELYFKTKPNSVNNKSGITNPGVIISICDATKESPKNNSVYADSSVKISWTGISSSTDASTPTKFTFRTPILVDTNAYYGINVLFEDQDYALWDAVAGDPAIGSSSQSGGSVGSYDGSLFDGTNNDFLARRDADLKFKVNVARISSNTATIPLVNDSFEFLTVARNTTKDLQGGEKVYQLQTLKTGNVTLTVNSAVVTGTLTSFLTSVYAGDYIAFTDNTTGTINANTQLCKVASVTNNTVLTLTSVPGIITSNTSGRYFVPPVAVVHEYDWANKKLYLKQSTANSTVYFAAGNTLFGDFSKANVVITSVDNKAVNAMVPRIVSWVPSVGSLDIRHTFGYNDGGTYKANLSLYAEHTEINKLNVPLIKGTYYPIIMSRSLEVAYPSALYSQDKSAVFEANVSISGLTANGLFETPVLSNNALDILVYENQINNDVTAEETNNGNAISKHVTLKIPLANTYMAEDLRVYLDAYKPVSTNVFVYAKLWNSIDPESFDDKNWTKLDLKDGIGLNSPIGSDQTVELTYGLPKYPESNNTLAGIITTTANSTTITGIGTSFNTDLIVNDLIKIYSPIFPANYQIGVVGTVTNSTSVILTRPISNTSIPENVVGSGLKIDKLKYKHTAFNNILNDNVARYYNNSMVEFDGFNMMSLKIVLTANTPYIVPYVDRISGVGVSA